MTTTPDKPTTVPTPSEAMDNKKQDKAPRPGELTQNQAQRAIVDDGPVTIYPQSH